MAVDYGEIFMSVKGRPRQGDDARALQEFVCNV